MLLSLLLACQTADLSPAQAPPPPAPVISPMVPSTTATLQIETGLGPGVRVWAISGVGGPAAGPCPAVLGGLCVSIAHPRAVGSSVTDAAGLATVSFTSPSRAPMALTFQVVRPDPAAPWVSGTTQATVLVANRDGDRDGLDNAVEVRHGLNPLLADTDGGGTSDGQEVLFDQTDPLQPADDVHAETRCLGDGLDDDADGLTDCADPDCVAICPELNCTDGVDNDLDQAVDCADLDCPACREICNDNVDNDRDQTIDCADRDCPACAEICGNGRDDDRDRYPDAFDPDCPVVEICDGLDHDSDGLAGCADPDCACPEDCANGVDDDRDLRADCADDDCPCVEDCTNVVDDDRDGLADCADADCGLLCGEDCGNGADDDADGLVDCEDGGCTDLCTEDCHNGVDDNGDAWVDCQDDSCWSDPLCPRPDHIAWVTAGSIHTRVEHDNYAAYGGCGTGFTIFKAATASDVVGAVRVRHAGRVDTCAWRVDRGVFVEADRLTIDSSTFVSSTTYGHFSQHNCNPTRNSTHEGTRTGFRVEPGCDLADSGFLPQRLVAQVPDRANTLAGAPWYDGRSDHRTWSSAGNGRYSSAGDGAPLMPAGVYGVCATGAPTLVADPTVPWGLAGVCPP